VVLYRRFAGRDGKAHRQSGTSSNGVMREASIAAGLTGLMILLFLGSWHSTVIVCISIPLSILVSLIGNMVNIMTLGGPPLAVGTLVDNATVEI
jgi:multidrug efflux pump subunit AcrB